MKIVILKEPSLPRSGIKCDIFNTLLPNGLTMEVCNVDQIVKEGISGDFFYNWHGEIYPGIIEEQLLSFFKQGGGLFHLGGIPFETPMKWVDGEWQKEIHTFGEIRNHRGYGPLDSEMDVFRAKLGLQVYDLAYPMNEQHGMFQVFDRNFFLFDSFPGNLPQKGINLSNSIPLFVMKPELFLQDHRAYQARPTCRESHCAGKLMSPDGTAVATSLLLTKCWGNPYVKEQSVTMRPWAIFTGIIEQEVPAELIQGMLEWISCPVFLKNIDLEFATIHPSESVGAQVELHGTLPVGWNIKAYQSKLTKKQFKTGAAIQWGEIPTSSMGTKVSLHVKFDEEAFLIPIKFVIIDEKGGIRDYVESAVVPWKPTELENSPRLKPNGAYFDIYKEGQQRNSGWLSGTNWQDRHQFAFTWHNPNPLRVANDALAIAESGITFVRPHYFMPGWFRVVPGKVFEETHADLYNQFEAGPEISEKHLRALEAHIMIFASMGLVFMPSVYTNIGIKMGMPSHWIGTSRLFVVRELIENQKIFAKQIMERFGNIPAIAWDLDNEPDTAMHQAGDWLNEHKAIWGATGQLVGIGAVYMKDNVKLGEAADWHSLHSPCCKIPESFHTGKPCIVQEAWVPTPTTYEGENDLEFYLHRAISWTLRFGGAGFMPWNWNMSFMNWRYGGGFVDFWDLHLGACVHADATPRRGKTVIRNWSLLLDGISFDQTANSQVVIIYPKSCLDGKGSVEYLDLLYQKNIPFSAINDIDFADSDLGRTKLVIVPLYGLGYRRSSWEKLRQFAEAGGVVWAHNDSLNTDETGNLDYTRKIPELAGCEDVGKGYFNWCMGWNYDRDKDDPYDTDMVALAKLLDEIPLFRKKNDSIPLVDGEIRFQERFSTDEQSMAADWLPKQKLPDRNVVTKIEVVDCNGHLQRGWSGEGDPLEIEGIYLSSERPFFFIRQDANRFLLAGDQIRVAGNIKLKDVRLMDWRFGSSPKPIDGLVHIFEKGDYQVISLESWQHLHWVEVNLKK